MKRVTTSNNRHTIWAAIQWWCTDVFLFVYWGAIWLESLDSLSSASRTAGKRWFGFNRPVLRLFSLSCYSCPKKHSYKEGKDPCRHSIHEHLFSHKVAWRIVEDKVFLYWNFMIVLLLGDCSQFDWYVKERNQFLATLSVIFQLLSEQIPGKLESRLM